jgi:hypothetical protein
MQASSRATALCAAHTPTASQTESLRAGDSVCLSENKINLQIAIYRWGARGCEGTRFPLFEKSLAKAFLKKGLKTHFAFCTRMNGVKVSRLRRASFLCHKRQKLLFLYTLSTNQGLDEAGFF